MINISLYIFRKCRLNTIFEVGDIVDYPGIHISGLTITKSWRSPNTGEVSFVLEKHEEKGKIKSEIMMSGVTDKNIILHKNE